MARVRVLETEKRSPGRHETSAALNLAERLPRLVLEARRAAATLTHGIHGRRRAGVGETFWQFRPFVTGEAAQRVDWRRSARDDRLYVREREWETAQNVWLWIDRSASMGYVSSLAQAPKIERALVLGMALADTFVNAGERVGLLGLMRARASRQIAEKVAEAIAGDPFGIDEDLPPGAPIGRFDEAVLISDFLSPPVEITGVVDGIAGRGARGHLLMIVDPVEETFPFSGQAVLHEPEIGLELRVGDAGSWGVAYRDRIKLHREAVAEVARRRGWTFTVHHTDRPATEAALRLVTLVQATRGGHLGPLAGLGG
jgi:uncharacterized protein (DUF58 family)